MDDRRKPRKVGMIPCLQLLKQGASRPSMEKIKATKAELQRVIKQLNLREAEFRSRPESEQRPIETEPMSDEDAEKEKAIADLYNLDTYDDEPVESGISYTTDAMLLNSTPESDCSDSSDDEDEEFIVKPDDNLIIAGQVTDDVCMLQLYVLNVEEQEFFLLNDTYLPSYPVAVEWLNFNPKSPKTLGHYAAVGYMDPEIHLWDLNMANCLEPAFTLGSKKQKKTMRHKDAVMDLAWNTNTRHVMASGSADQTVILWDLQECKSVTRLDCFAEKVQTMQWHPMDPQTLLTGVCDGVVKLFDCRSPENHKSWIFDGEIERVMWNKFEPMYFFATTEKGLINYVDVRTDKPVWSLEAHTSSVGGIVQSSFCSDFLLTGSQDETAKVWDLKDNKPTFVYEKKMNIGQIYSITACPDSPYVFAAGGNRPENHLYVWDAREQPEVIERFKDRYTMVVQGSDDSVEEKMDEDSSEASSGSPSKPFQFFRNKGKESDSAKKTGIRGLATKKSAKSLTKKKKHQK